MAKVIAARLSSLVPTILLVSVLIFLLQNLMPGDPALIIAGDEADEQTIAEIRRRYGLDQPVFMQYFYWLANVLSGDLGTSSRLHEPVLTLIVQKIPATLQLALMASFIAIIVGVSAGVVSAAHKGKSWDWAANAIGLWGISIPHFWLGIMFIYFFSIYLNWLPPAGYVSPFEDLRQSLATTIMPAVVLATSMSAVLMRHTRSSMLKELGSDYSRTASAKGAPRSRVVVVHALRNALTPVITLTALEIGGLMSGVVLTEQIFSIPGIGKVLIDAVFNRDYIVVQGVVLFISVIYITLNLIADILYIAANPRVRS